MTRRRLWRPLAWLAVLGAGWVVTASWLLCKGLGRVDLFVFPYDQWLQLAACWRCMAWTPHSLHVLSHPLVVFLVSGLVPTVLLAMLGVMSLLLRRRRGNMLVGATMPLYGQSELARPPQLRRSGFDVG